MEYDPAHVGELLRVLAIEQHMITLRGDGRNHYRARDFAAEDWPKAAPLRPADICMVMHPNLWAKALWLNTLPKIPR